MHPVFVCMRDHVYLVYSFACSIIYRSRLCSSCTYLAVHTGALLLHHARRAERAHVLERDCGGRCSPLSACAWIRYRSHALCCVALSLVIAIVFRNIQEYVPEQVSLPEDVNRTFTIHACHIRMVTRFSGTYCLLSLRHICSHIFQHNDGISTRIQLRLRFSTSAL